MTRLSASAARLTAATVAAAVVAVSAAVRGGASGRQADVRGRTAGAGVAHAQTVAAAHASEGAHPARWLRAWQAASMSREHLLHADMATGGESRPHRPGPGAGSSATANGTKPPKPPPPPRPTPPPCPEGLQSQVNATGLLPVTLFGAMANDALPDDDAVRAAINASASCGGAVFFPPGRWIFNSTVEIVDRSGLELRGAGTGAAQFDPGNQATVHGPPDGPVFFLNGTRGFVEKVLFSNLDIAGKGTGVKIFNAALIRFSDVAITVGSNIDKVNVSTDGCLGCNIVFGSDNAALVVEDTFWLWAEDSMFAFEPTASGGQRPAVILRGTDKDGHDKSVNTVYLALFNRIVFAGGGVQYQNTANANQWPGWFTFSWCVMENSALPLLDVQGQRGKTFMGVQSVSINDCQSADALPPHYAPKSRQGVARFAGGDYVPVVGLNASGSRLDGVTIVATTTTERHAPAVRVYDGTVDAVTVMDGQLVGGYDVVDANDVPIGSFSTRSAGGLVLVSKPMANASSPALSDSGDADPPGGNVSDADASVVSGNTTHTLLFGMSGEQHSRMAIDADGVVRHGDGSSPSFHTAVGPLLSASAPWDPSPLPPGQSVTLNVPVLGCAVGDVVQASHDGLGGRWLALSAHVASASTVAVLLTNVGHATSDADGGVVRVLVTRVTVL